MQKTFSNFQKCFEYLFPAIWNFIKGFFRLIFLDAICDLYVATLSHWKKTRDLSDKLAVISSAFLIALFLLYGLHGLYIDFHHWLRREWYAEVMQNNSQKEIGSFFEKYNERFLAHDCSFMATVGADEAMYDKWGHTKYENYKCEEWVRFQKKIMIPISINPIEMTGNKFRAKGEAVVIFQNQGEPLQIRAIYFDLWKLDIWDLWHFDNPKTGPRDIDIVVYKR